MNHPIRAGILGTGSYLPERVLGNSELAARLNCSEEWILKRTGIKERRIVDEGTATSDLATAASLRALEAARTKPEDLDLIICATYTPDMSFPATACIIQDKLKARNAAAYDIEAACAGFILSLITATQFIQTGAAKRILVVGSDVNSSVINKKDVNVSVLFGDGAGAVVVGPKESHGEVLAFDMGADGRGSNLFTRPAGGSRLPPTVESIEKGLHYIHMLGRELFKFGVRMISGAAATVLKRAGLCVKDIDLFIPHQANMRIIEAAVAKLGIPLEKTFINIEKYANTTSGTIPIALDEALRKGRIKQGDLVLMVGFGAGLCWGSTIMKW